MSSALSRLFCDIVDLKTPFTASHNLTTAEVAVTLAKYYNFSEGELTLMRIAGYVHDIGKLATPLEILEKPGKLEPGEFAIVKAHPFHTYTVLSHLRGLETVRDWAGFHHERLDGSGYPFHLTAPQLPLGARIMAVSDVYSALRESRPYRKSMSRSEAMTTLEQMVSDNKIDGEIVSLIRQNEDEVDIAFLGACSIAYERYKDFWQKIALISD